MVAVANNYTAFLDKMPLKNTTIAANYTAYIKKCNLFFRVMENMNQAKENRKQYTKIIAKEFSFLSGKYIDEWDIIMRYHLKRSSVEYAFLMPNGRASFQKGSYENRIKAVNELLEKVGAFPILSSLKQEINKWLEEITALRDSQKKHNLLYLKYLLQIEPCRKALSQEMDIITAYLLKENLINMAVIASFFMDKNKHLVKKETKIASTDSADNFLGIIDNSMAIDDKPNNGSFIVKWAALAPKKPIYFINNIHRFKNNSSPATLEVPLLRSG